MHCLESVLELASTGTVGSQSGVNLRPPIIRHPKMHAEELNLTFLFSSNGN